MKEKLMRTTILKKVIGCLIAFSCLMACDRLKQTTKETLNKTGETVAKGGSEFIDGVVEGVSKTFECKVQLAPAVRARAISSGKFTVSSGQDSTDNRLTCYLIFNQEFKGSLSAKVIDMHGQEYGRSAITVDAKPGEARFFDFVFDKRTDIERKSTFTIDVIP